MDGEGRSDEGMEWGMERRQKGQREVERERMDVGYGISVWLSYLI